MNQTMMHQYSVTVKNTQAVNIIPRTTGRTTERTIEKNIERTAKRNTEKTSDRVTEVVIPQKYNNDPIIYPLIASLSQHTQNTPHQWITWITHRKSHVQKAKHFGASANDLRIVHIDANTDYRWVIWETLKTGNSHTVIAEMPSISNRDMNEMELAAKQGDCNGIIICAFSHNP